ncbi:DUF1003 domain-containing protein [Flavobacterium coralii]|uniref:DUF1003 domain-containing protein n=1 Tax=Flavobacterium coralii TaxID=2838017 RepID=UPI000C3D1ED8|nr:hypothetical protein [Flavobacterium sp.]|tara:strand:- start:14393 stop:15091 length:699 start_codon:yes stop_codon:yes gene_type:complete
MKTFVSDISGKEFPDRERISGKLVRTPILDVIKQENPGFDENCSLAMSELNHYREQYIANFLVKEMGDLSVMENRVLEALKNKTLLTDKLEDEMQQLTFGQRIADRVATFGGSWTFIISFMCFLLLWIAVNVAFLANKGFDPYPFILLNLILSCIAALQAPVIMMSQNRQEEKDRERAKNDYLVNLKSELEVRMLHEKIDHLILHQEQALIEIQRVQIDMMNDILARLEKKI